ncbi:MAG: ABC transporter permease [Deltaproteobacteria bacterium]|nr:ABC transporter permease [Deltaproteobacteria bacterium]
MSGARAALMRLRGSLLVLGMVAWEALVTVARVPDYLLPAPTRVAQELWDRFPLLLRHTGVTLGEVGLGLVAAVAGGGLLAVSMAHSRLLHRALYPLLAFLQAVPKVTVAPLFVIWLGYGIGSKVLMVLLITFFPIVVNLTAGLLLVEPDLVRLVRSYRASPWQIFLKIRFPHAIPYLLAGMRIAVALAVVGAVVAEFVGADRGLGYLILLSNAELRTPLLFASLAWLGAIGAGLFGLLHWTERWLLPWAQEVGPERMEITGF